MDEREGIRPTESLRDEGRGATLGTKVGALLTSAITVYVLLLLCYTGMGTLHEQRYWEALERAPAFPSSARLAEEARTLERAPVPIGESMRLLATKGRTAFPAIRPDAPPRAPLAGWVHHPGFKSAVERAEAWRSAHEASADESSSAQADATSSVQTEVAP